jgi:divalent metal cation (Fe/Co/Zn/Cd) transporter
VAEDKRTRVRRSGHEFFVDLTVAVHCDVSFAAAHKIAHESEKAVREKFPQADVVVHVDPAGESHENTAGRIRETAARHELFAHAIAVSSAGGQGAIEMHLEVDPALSVADAHRKVSAFEKDLHETLPSFPLITTHIEPVGTPNVHQRRPDPGDEARIRNLVGRLAEENREHVQFHDLTTRREEGKLAVIFHCACDGTISVAEAHDLTEKFEARLREGMPELGRVVIHIEPRENSHH